MKKRTMVTHLPEVPMPSDNRPLVAPIYQSVKFEIDGIDETLRAFRGEREGYFYSRVANPTVRQLELLLAELQWGSHRLDRSRWKRLRPQTRTSCSRCIG